MSAALSTDRRQNFIYLNFIYNKIWSEFHRQLPQAILSSSLAAKHSVLHLCRSEILSRFLHSCFGSQLTEPKADLVIVVYHNHSQTYCSVGQPPHTMSFLSAFSNLTMHLLLRAGEITRKNKWSVNGRFWKQMLPAGWH